MHTIRQTVRPTTSRGNALMEYVVPAAVILLSAGVLTTVLDANKLIGAYFLSASGHTTQDLNGTKLRTQGLAENSYGEIDNGLGGFSSAMFVTVRNGSGVSTGEAESTGGFFYLGLPPVRANTTPPNREQLFQNTKL